MSLHGDPFSGVWGRLQDGVTCVGLRVALGFLFFFVSTPWVPRGPAQQVG